MFDVPFGNAPLQHINRGTKAKWPHHGAMFAFTSASARSNLLVAELQWKIGAVEIVQFTPAAGIAL